MGFVGTLDEVAVYGSTLSDSQIKHHYEIAQKSPGLYPSTVLGDSPAGYWRLDETAGLAADSSPNGYHGAYSGSILLKQSGVLPSVIKNQIKLRFRELALDALTQLDLDSGFTQADLDNYGTIPTTEGGLPLKTFGKKVQPDYGTALFASRTQQDIDLLPQESLDEESQFSLERIPDYLASAYLEVAVEWDSTDGGVLKLSDAEGNGYTFEEVELAANQDYILFVTVEDDSLRAVIYESDEIGTIRWDRVTFDTTTLIDSSFVQRRKGRNGWYANFPDTDASLKNIRSRGMMHGEYRSHGFESFTPVEGASITVGGSGYREYATGVYPAPWGGAIEIDTQKSTSGESFKIVNPGTMPMWGLQSNSINFDSFEDYDIRFKLWFPSSAPASLECFLYGENGRIVPLSLGRWQPDRWEEIKVVPTEGWKVQSGEYSLVIVQSLAGVKTDWYISDLSISAPLVRWSGRGFVDDAWRQRENEWIPFRRTVNDPYGGIVFTEKSPRMQVRAEALQQDARIESIRVTPRYAGLGRFVWSDQKPYGQAPPVAGFTYTLSGRKASFDGSSSTDSDGFVASYHWTFGDGERDSGPAVSHTYMSPGTYYPTLTIMDNNGNRNFYTQVVTI